MIYLPTGLDRIAIHFLDNSPSVKGKKIIDIGCGKGYISYLLTTKGAKVTAMDISNIAGEIPKATNIPFINSLKDINTIFDIIWCHHVLEHINNPILFLKTLRNLGRELWLTVPRSKLGYVTGHIIAYSMPILCEHLRRAGWDTENASYRVFMSDYYYKDSESQGGNLWARIKSYPNYPKLANFPSPMAKIMREKKICYPEDFNNFNWDLKKEKIEIKK